MKWRTGSEARISHLKRDYGWARTRVDGIGGTQAWCGWGVLAHNATKVSALLQDADPHAGVAPAAAAKRPTNSGAGPPRRAADAPAA